MSIKGVVSPQEGKNGGKKENTVFHYYHVSLLNSPPFFHDNWTSYQRGLYLSKRGIHGISCKLGVYEPKILSFFHSTYKNISPVVCSPCVITNNLLEKCQWLWLSKDTRTNKMAMENLCLCKNESYLSQGLPLQEFHRTINRRNPLVCCSEGEFLSWCCVGWDGSVCGWLKVEWDALRSFHCKKLR